MVYVNRIVPHISDSFPIRRPYRAVCGSIRSTAYNWPRNSPKCRNNKDCPSGKKSYLVTIRRPSGPALIAWKVSCNLYRTPSWSLTHSNTGIAHWACSKGHHFPIRRDIGIYFQPRFIGYLSCCSGGKGCFFTGWTEEEITCESGKNYYNNSWEEHFL